MRRTVAGRNVRRSASACLALALTTTFLSNTANAATPVISATNVSTVSEWNDIALTTAVGDKDKAPPELPLYLGFLQAAVYDAAVGIKGRYQPYRFKGHA